MNPTQLTIMLQMQFDMNTKINPLWMFANYQYLRAIVVEGVEAIEHHGWKWWKQQNKDMSQLRMELVDIWHFALSHCLVITNGNTSVAHSFIASEQAMGENSVEFCGGTYFFESTDTVTKLELLIGLAVTRRFSIALFESILTDCDMSWNDLYRMYVGKNVLNFFRQDNGYKQGTYLKTWGGLEDNEALVEEAAKLDVTSATYKDDLYKALGARYQASLS